MWEAVVTELGGLSTLALGVLPGHGPRPWFSTEPDFFSTADELANDLPYSGPAWLVGYSTGARVALGIAARHPTRVAGLVLVGVDPGLADTKDRTARASWDDAQASQLETVGVAEFVHDWE